MRMLRDLRAPPARPGERHCWARWLAGPTWSGATPARPEKTTWERPGWNHCRCGPGTRLPPRRVWRHRPSRPGRGRFDSEHGRARYGPVRAGLVRGRIRLGAGRRSACLVAPSEEPGHQSRPSAARPRLVTGSRSRGAQEPPGCEARWPDENASTRRIAFRRPAIVPISTMVGPPWVDGRPGLGIWTEITAFG